MNNKDSRAATATWKKWAVTGTAVAVALGISGLGLQAANAGGPDFPVYDESDSPNPLSMTGGLVFYQSADLGWVVGGDSGVPLADVDSLAYTVADTSTLPNMSDKTYAPSYQLITKSDQKSYARLVWEPYMQAPAQDKSDGTYTDLQDGLWWTNKIQSGPGSQSSPQPLSFFENGGDSGWTNVVVRAVDIHQGSTSASTSTVTRVDYNGTDIPLGDADQTPFSQANLDSAVNDATTPLNAQISDLTDQLTAAQADADAKDAANADLQKQLTAANADVAAKNAANADLQKQLTAAQKALTDYTKTHHTADNTNIGDSRALLSGTPVHGKTVGVVKSGAIAKASSVKYQWYLGGKAVKGATKSSYLVPSSAKGKSVSVMVTGTVKYIVFSVHSQSLNAK